MRVNKGLLCGSSWMFTTCRANGWHIFGSAHSLGWRFTTHSRPPAPASSLLFVLADVRQALAFLSLFGFFGVGVESFCHVFLILGAICVETLIDPWISFRSRPDTLPLLWFGFRSCPQRLLRPAFIQFNLWSKIPSLSRPFVCNSPSLLIFHQPGDASKLVIKL